MANKYCLINKVLTKEQCYKYARLIRKVNLIQDPQCPLSDSVYGVYDFLLLELKPLVEGVFGSSIYPTYSYARIYKPNEELEPHTDRPSCEISCTLTLSTCGDIWPIYFQRKDNTTACIEIPIGSLIVYKGMELRHWREKYTQGSEQIQVFLHYVAAKGIYADHIFDKRKSLNV